MTSSFTKQILLLLLAVFVSAGDTGTTFFIVGDYGVVTNITQAEEVFDAINMVVGQSTDQSIDRPEFLITVGDNIYPAVADAPTVAEFDLMLSLFDGNRTNLSPLPVWAVRGNHDAMFNWTTELILTMEQSQWMLPSLYYTKMIPSGSNGELLGMLFVDSVLMVCSNYTAPTGLLTDPDIIKLTKSTCSDP